jgi:hypothetical protein
MSNERHFEITDIKLVGSYIFNLPKNEDCTICRNTLHAASIYNQEKGIDSYVVSGICQHSYHNECIKSWIDKNKYCPICFEKWESETSNKIDKSDYNKNQIDKDKMTDDYKNKMINDFKHKMIDDYKDKIKDDYKDDYKDYIDMPPLISEQKLNKKILKTINIISSSIDHDQKFSIISSAQNLIKEIATDLIIKDLDDENINLQKNIIIQHVFPNKSDISGNKDP